LRIVVQASCLLFSLFQGGRLEARTTIPLKAIRKCSSRPLKKSSAIEISFPGVRFRLRYFGTVWNSGGGWLLPPAGSAQTRWLQPQTSSLRRSSQHRGYAATSFERRSRLWAAQLA
jgi:hypothetical protein